MTNDDGLINHESTPVRQGYGGQAKNTKIVPSDFFATKEHREHKAGLVPAFFGFFRGKNAFRAVRAHSFLVSC
jgi:hypothetical protein